MKNIIKQLSIITTAIILFSSSSSSAKSMRADFPEVEAIKGGKVNAPDEEWTKYSEGLYHKNLALDQKDMKNRRTLLARAISIFNSVLSKKTNLDRVYLQLSECYYYSADMEKSLEFANKALDINNKDIRPYNRIFHIYIRLKDYAKASEILEKCLKINPNLIQVQYILAEHYHRRTKETDKAISSYKRIIEIARHMPVEDYYRENALYMLGYIYYKQGETEAATEKFKETLAINQNNENAIFFMALIYMDTYDLERADAFASAFLRMKPDNKMMHAVVGFTRYLKNDPSASGHLRLGGGNGSLDGILSMALYYESIGQYENAEKLLRTSYNYLNRNIALHLALGKISKKKNDLNSAFNEFLTAGILAFSFKQYHISHVGFIKAAKINSLVSGIYYYLGKIAEERGSKYLAISYYKEALELKNDIDLILNIGYLYGTAKDYDSAVEFFSRAIKTDPQNSRPYFFKGLISLWQERYPEARQSLEKAISLDDKIETYYFYHAIIMDKTLKIDEAIKSLKLAIKYNPQSARALNYLGYIYADNSIDIDESLNLIKKAIDLEPSNGAFIDSLGWAYFRKGNYKMALENLLNAQDILGKAKMDDPVVFDHIGDTYLRLGKKKDAVFYWNKSIMLKTDEKIRQKIKQTEK